MPNGSIGALTYSVIADTIDFQEGMTASRKELGLAKKAFLETRTPAEALSLEIEGLTKLLKKGAISQETYNRKVKELQTRARTATSEVRDLGRDVRGLQGHMESARLSVGTLIKGFLGFHAVRGVLGGITGEMQRIDRTAKAARKLGLFANDLVGIRLAAEDLSGMTEGQLDTALQRMTRRISEAAAGTGEARGAIQELGLSAVELNRRGPAFAFRQIADAIRKVSSEQDQLRIAFKLFDSEGAGLVNTLKEGSEVIDEFNRKAKELGLTFSDSVAKEVQEANEAVNDLKRSLQGLGTVGAKVSAPLAKWFSELVIDWQRDFERAFEGDVIGGDIFARIGFGGEDPPIHRRRLLDRAIKDATRPALEAEKIRQEAEVPRLEQESAKRFMQSIENLIGFTKDNSETVMKFFKEQQTTFRKSVEDSVEFGDSGVPEAMLDFRIGVDRLVKSQDETAEAAKVARRGSVEEFKAIRDIEQAKRHSEEIARQEQNQRLEMIGGKLDQIKETLREIPDGIASLLSIDLA